jgi:hypothetical protein
MQRDSLPAHCKIFGYGRDILCVCGDQMNDGPSGRVSDRLENISSCLHIMQVCACKYKCKHLLAQSKKNKFFVIWEDCPPDYASI